MADGETVRPILTGRIPDKGRDGDAVMADLRALKGHDAPWRSGRVWAGVYDPGARTEALIKAAYAEYLSENALYFNYYPSALTLERDLIRQFATLLQGDSAVVGNFTSGGTESIMTAMKSYRDAFHARHLGVTPEIVAPITAHAAFHKAAHYLGFKMVVTPFVPGSFRADVAAMEAAIGPATAVLVASAPCYSHGVVDPVADIGALALRRGVALHVDGCVGAIHLAMMREAGMAVPAHDFAVPGVTSISADLHKYGYAAKNASMVFWRNAELRRPAMWSCAGTTGYAVINTTILSSKSTGPLAAAWAAVQGLGREGYIDIVRQVQAASDRLRARIAGIDGIAVLGAPDMCMLTLAAEPGSSIDVYQLDAAMARRGWFLQVQFSAGGGPANLHFSTNLSNVEHVDAMADDLAACVAELLANPQPFDPGAVAARIMAIVSDPGPDMAAQVTALLGLDGPPTPEGMAKVNAVLDALPDPVTDHLLGDYLNTLFV
jgi:sphinganine-1-phosphate aldolase